MKAMVMGGLGLSNLALRDVPDPKPGPGQVLVRVRACSLNYRDLLTVQGVYNPRQPLPLIPCSDGAGEVAAVGEGVSRVKPGDRVAGIFAQQWLGGEPSRERLRSSLGGPYDGMLADYIVLDEAGVVAIPPHLSFVEAATLPCAAVTAWCALNKYRRLTAGDTLLAQGTGGVSVFALQFARLAGAAVIITSSSDAKLQRARDLGAMHGINYRREPDWDRRARELTGRRGVDHIVEVGGAGTLAKSLNAVRIGGFIAVIGVLAGAAAPLSVLPILMSSITVQGVTVGSRDDFEAMNRAIALHGLKPVVDRVFPFAEAAAAFQWLASGGHFGKVVISDG